MADLDRMVAGLRCRDVLARLSEYLDHDLSPSDLARIEQHVRGCDHCERFGGRFAATVTALKRELGQPAALGVDVAARLRAALAVGITPGEAP
jgi:anti-sigma factor RsiW